MISKISALIVDDEKNSRDVLRKILEKFFQEVELLGEADNVNSAFDLINKLKPQLVFLDIEMRPSSGFTLLKKFEEVPFKVVFVTSYDHYAINAIKFSALDYLLKPVEVSDLKIAIERVKKSLEVKSSGEVQIVNLLKTLDKEKDRKIGIHVGDHVKLLEEGTIVAIEADGRYCNIITLDNERYTTARHLGDFEEYLGENSAFIKIHKSCLINIKHIREYSKGDPCIIEMKNGRTFEVARRKKQEILERLKKG